MILDNIPVPSVVFTANSQCFWRVLSYLLNNFNCQYRMFLVLYLMCKWAEIQTLRSFYLFFLFCFFVVGGDELLFFIQEDDKAVLCFFNLQYRCNIGI